MTMTPDDADRAVHNEMIDDVRRLWDAADRLDQENARLRDTIALNERDAHAYRERAAAKERILARFGVTVTAEPTESNSDAPVVVENP